MIVTRLHEGFGPKYISRELIGMGVAESEANALVARVERMRRDIERRRGYRYMLGGAAFVGLAVVGALIFSSETRYVIPSGALLVGLGIFFCGLSKVL